MTEEKKKDRKKLIYCISLAAAVLIIFPCIITVFSSYTVIVEDRDGNYYRAKNILILGNSMISRRDPESSVKKSDALKAEPASYSLSYRSMMEIRNIEIIPGPDEDSEIEGIVDSRYLGRYNVIVQGHSGVLYLREKDGKLYGSMRFPKWGKGAVEYLRRVRISYGKIRFTRSANSSKEIKRLGANYYFTHRFYGTYSKSGKKIEGYFINDRKEKHLWEGSR
jgi:hypothetical protein